MICLWRPAHICLWLLRRQNNFPVFGDDKAEKLAGHYLLGYSTYYEQTEGLKHSAEEVPNSLLLVFYYLLK